MNPIAALRAQTNDIRGSAAIEVALTCPVLLVFLFGIIQFGFAMWLQNALDYSVAEAALCASINTTVCGSPSEIQSYAANQSGANFNTSIFSVSTPSCGNRRLRAAGKPSKFGVPLGLFISVLGDRGGRRW